MTNAKAITALSEMRADLNCFDKEEEPYYRALSMAIAALRNEQKAEESLLKSDPDSVSKGDVIYRQAAIDAPFKKWDGKAGVTWIPLEHIEQLPSAQPKAIRPKFVEEDRYIKNHFQTFPHCPKCNYDLETGDCYCRVCGCYIDWSEDDEE